MAWVNEIYDKLFAPNTICIAQISHGKDSLAMLRAIKLLGLPLHKIIHTEMWATDTIPAELPPMVEFKREAEKKILELYGIEVDNVCAVQKVCSQVVNVERERERESRTEVAFGSHTKTSSILDYNQDNMKVQSKGFLLSREVGVKNLSTKKLTYEDIFYRRFKEGRKEGRKRVRIPNDAKQVLHGGTQEYTDSRCCEGIGVQATSSHPYGFPISIKRGQWCQMLKRFLQAP